MIPPFLITKAASLLAPIAAKLTSPLVKWGLIGAVLILSNLWTWHSTTVRISVKCEHDKAEAIAQQAAEYSKQTALVVMSREEVMRQLDVTRQEKDKKIIEVQKRLVNYERNAKKSGVPVPPDSIGMFNAVSGLLPYQGILPATSASPREPHESPEAGIETTQLLLANNRARTDCATELKSLWDDYDALATTVRNDYRIATGQEQ